MNSLPRFDLLFRGELVPGTDPAEARRDLRDLFRMTDEVADRLFSGSPVTVKRGVDEATAGRYRERFRAAGALLEMVPVAAEGGAPEGVGPGEERRSESGDGSQPPEKSGLSLAPPGALLEELPRVCAAPAKAPDTSHLSLVAGNDWTLLDCAPPPGERPPPPDIRHLKIEPRPAEVEETSD